ncbi:MAG: response regulator [Bacteroidia bacterium]
MAEKIKILLVEDSIEDAKFASIQLRQSFGEDSVLQTTDYFSKATALVAENKFDLIILDLSLPDSRGLNTFKELLASCNIPIIIYTGLTDELIITQAKKAGASDYLIKGETSAAKLKASILGTLERVGM